MKSVSIKLDDFLLDLVNRKAKEKKVTRMEIIRSAVISFLINENDADDLAYIKNHKNDKLLSFEDTFNS